MLNAAQYTHVIATECINLYGYTGTGSEAYWLFVGIQFLVLLVALIITLIGAVVYAKSLKGCFYIFCLSMVVGIASFAIHRDIELFPLSKCVNNAHGREVARH